MKPDRAWVPLLTERRLNLRAPDPFAWTDRDLVAVGNGTAIAAAGRTETAGSTRSDGARV